MFLQFTTGSKSNPSVEIIPMDKILRISQNPPLKCNIEDFNPNSFDEEKDVRGILAIKAKLLFKTLMRITG